MARRHQALGEIARVLVPGSNAATAELLRIAPSEPCLLLHRRTWSRGQVASRARLTHPGSRYRLGAALGCSGAR